ncbi:hypothetical protein [Streptacidiphilus cavernicola]|uniref:Uncharacterized protein n=1 Tax=Streptacidiphilus cavernicola TaxID=3342716 RepID=A0ABV6VQV1_9ACTN
MCTTGPSRAPAASVYRVAFSRAELLLRAHVELDPVDLVEQGERGEQGGGSRFRYDHTGFTGVGGLFMSRILGGVRTKMLTVGLSAVLDDLDDRCGLRSDSVLRPRQF